MWCAFHAPISGCLHVFAQKGKVVQVVFDTCAQVEPALCPGKGGPPHFEPSKSRAQPPSFGTKLFLKTSKVKPPGVMRIGSGELAGLLDAILTT